MASELTEKELEVATVVLKAVAAHFGKMNVSPKEAIIILERVIEYFKERSDV